ncbi:MAG: RNA polymerase sigma factor [Myxococcota bacterium]
MSVSDILFAPPTPFHGASDDAEAELIKRLLRAERSAVAEVYDEHHAAVRAFARRLVGEPAAAEDLVHEVFVSLPKAAKNFRGQSSLRTFLISIAVNHARHHVRAAARRRSAFNKLEQEPIGEVQDPEKVTERKQLAQALTRALDTLPLDQRVAFVLCEIEERTSVDAARIADVPEGTMRTRLFHAKKKLRAELEKEGFR